MKVLALVTWAQGATKADFAPHRTGEQQAIWSAYRAGILREVYYQADPVVATLIYEVDDVAEVRAHLDRLPMMQAGLLVCQQIVRLGPWQGFEVLFDPSLIPA